MDKTEFCISMKDICHAYDRPDLDKKPVLETWYKYLGNFSAEAFAAVVSEYILHEPKAPSISDLVYKCKDKDWKLKKEAERRMEEETEEVGDDW